jgi:hypothetical protein
LHFDGDSHESQGDNLQSQSQIDESQVHDLQAHESHVDVSQGDALQSHEFELQVDESQADDSQVHDSQVDESHASLGQAALSHAEESHAPLGQSALSHAETVGSGATVADRGDWPESSGWTAFSATARVAIKNTAQAKPIRIMKRFLSLLTARSRRERKGRE